MAENLFSFCNIIAMIGWFMLIIAPFGKWTKPIIQTGIIPLLLALVYLYLILQNFGKTEGGFGSLEQVSMLFENKNLLLAGWIHYLSFDLWVGCWETGDARKHGIHRIILLPCQLLTFLLGPIGLLIYIIIRTIKTKRLFSHENF